MNEKPLVSKMSENFKFYGGISLLYGVLFTFCLYKNTSGITFPILIIATIWAGIYFLKKIGFTLQKGSWIYFAGMVLLAVSTAFTTSAWLHFFNYVGILLLIAMYLMHEFYNDKEWEFFPYLMRMCILFGTFIISIIKPFEHFFRFLRGGKKKRTKSFYAVLIGIAFAIGLLAIILPLLLKADAMFSKIFGDILKYINFKTIFLNLILIILGIVLLYSGFAAICHYNFPEDKEAKQKERFNPVVGITFTSVLAVIYMIFSVIQIVYVFVGVESGLPVGETHASYAREGFFELVTVGIINFVLVLICMYFFKKSPVLKGILTLISACTFIMIASAAYRMIYYVDEYHLTFLRAITLWFMVVLALLMAGLIIRIFNNKLPLFQYCVLVVGALYIAFSFARPDAIVAKYNVEHMETIKEDDLEYMLSNRLSLDAAPYIAKINPEKIDKDSDNIDPEYKYREDYYYDDYYYNYDYNDNIYWMYNEDYVKARLYGYFYDLNEENDDIYFRKANFSRILAKKVAMDYLKSHSADKKYWQRLYGYDDDYGDYEY
ncbi:MAG: DUF4173 domain-containing protein [Lachnospiraceae bacterium]|jgi:hypothetical protein|nr:DUF4173 domain-containing protein [Lachnospiraceae bacterium]